MHGFDIKKELGLEDAKAVAAVMARVEPVFLARITKELREELKQWPSEVARQTIGSIIVENLALRLAPYARAKDVDAAVSETAEALSKPESAASPPTLHDALERG